MTGLVTKINLNAKVSKVEGRIPDTTSLVTKTNFNAKVIATENKISKVADLLKNTNLDIKSTAVTNLAIKGGMAVDPDYMMANKNRLMI